MANHVRACTEGRGQNSNGKTKKRPRDAGASTCGNAVHTPGVEGDDKETEVARALQRETNKTGREPFRVPSPDIMSGSSSPSLVCSFPETVPRQSRTVAPTFAADLTGDGQGRSLPGAISRDQTKKIKIAAAATVEEIESKVEESKPAAAPQVSAGNGKAVATSVVVEADRGGGAKRDGGCEGDGGRERGIVHTGETEKLGNDDKSGMSWSHHNTSYHVDTLAATLVDVDHLIAQNKKKREAKEKERERELSRELKMQRDQDQARRTVDRDRAGRDERESQRDRERERAESGTHAGTIKTISLKHEKKQHCFVVGPNCPKW
jgi:hypothetical protein